MKTSAKKMRRSVLGMLTLAPLALSGCSPELTEEQMLVAAQQGDKAGAEVGQVQQEMVSVALNLSYTDDKFTFGKNKNNDLIVVQKRGAVSGKVEVAVLSGASNYQTYSMPWRSVPMGALALDANWDVETDASGDVYFIQKVGGASGKTEVHALSAASGYQQFNVHAATGLHQTDSTWDFEIGGSGDLFAIRKQYGATNSTEIHMLTRSSNYGSFLLQTGTPLHQTGDNFRFVVDNTTNDVWAIKQHGTPSGLVELHILEAASNWQRFSSQAPTEHPQNTTNTVDWAFTSNGSLTGIYKQNTGSGRSESHTYMPPRPSTQCNVPVSSASGGDVAYKGYVQLGAQSGTLNISFETYGIKDRIVLRKDGTPIFDSGCVSTSTVSSFNVPFSGPSTFANLEVYPNCAGESGTAWTVTVSCAR